MSRKGAVPLCLPDNHRWDPESQSIHINGDAQRRNLELCEEGLNVLKNIDDSVVVICISGPVRSGKSFFLSQIQTGSSFEVHHGTTSKTTGIWIASSEHSVMRNGRPSKFVFLDTEGLGSISTSDSKEDTTWERKLVALSLLLSSYFIFNSQGTPTYNDLLKLGFLSSFSKFVKKNSKGAPAGTTHQAYSSSPDFLWLVRDETLKPELENKPCSWSTYIKTAVLKSRGNHSKDVRNQIRRAVVMTFGKIDADALPFPAVDPEVLQLLDSPESIPKMNPKFSARLQAVTTKIIKSAKVKKEAGHMMTGKDLADLLQVYVKMLNTPNGIIDVESAWECLLAVKDAQGFYSHEMKALRLPCSKDEVDAFHSKTTQKALHLISKKAGLSSESDIEFYNCKFVMYTEEQLKSIHRKNEELSRVLCQRVKEKVTKDHLQMSHTAEDVQFDVKSIQIAKNEAIKEFIETARGPSKLTVLRELETLVSNFEESATKILTEKCVINSINLYNAEMATLEMPTTPHNLNEKHRRASLQAERFFTTNAPPSNEQLISYQREKLLGAMENEKWNIVENNECLSLEHCEKLIGSLKEKYLKPVRAGIGKNLQDFKDACDLVLECFDRQAIGPKAQYVRKKATEELELFIEQSRSRFLHKGLQEAKECYTRRLNSLILPCSDADLFRQGRICLQLAEERFCFYTKGIPSHLCKPELGNLNRQLQRMLDARKLENDSRSRQGHRELISQLENRFRLRETLESPWKRDKQEVRRKCSLILKEFKATAKGTRVDEFYEETQTRYAELVKQCSNEDTVKTAVAITGGIMLAGMAVFGLAKAIGGLNNDSDDDD